MHRAASHVLDPHHHTCTTATPLSGVQVACLLTPILERQAYQQSNIPPPPSLHLASELARSRAYALANGDNPNGLALACAAPPRLPGAAASRSDGGRAGPPVCTRGGDLQALLLQRPQESKQVHLQASCMVPL